MKQNETVAHKGCKAKIRRDMRGFTDSNGNTGLLACWYLENKDGEKITEEYTTIKALIDCTKCEPI